MAEQEPQWPMNYDVGPQEHLHALGVVSINFNGLEALLFPLFHHHLEQKLDRRSSAVLFAQMGNDKRLAAIKELFALHEKDKAVIGWLSEIIKCFNACADNRNHLMHSYSIKVSEDQGIIDLVKHSKPDWLARNRLPLKLEDIRKVADEIQALQIAIMRGGLFLQRRDNHAHLSQAPAFALPLIPTELPEPPAQPESLQKRLLLQETYIAQVRTQGPSGTNREP